MKHIRKFDNEGSPDELYEFLKDLLVDLKFGPVGAASLDLFGSGDVVGAVYDDDYETVTLVSGGHESLLEPDEDDA